MLLVVTELVVAPDVVALPAAVVLVVLRGVRRGIPVGHGLGPGCRSCPAARPRNPPIDTWRARWRPVAASAIPNARDKAAGRLLPLANLRSLTAAAPLDSRRYPARLVLLSPGLGTKTQCFNND